MFSPQSNPPPITEEDVKPKKKKASRKTTEALSIASQLGSGAYNA